MTKRRHMKEYESLTHLLAGRTPAAGMEVQARRGAYWSNTVQVRTPRAVGSGVLLTREGYLVTNSHVIPKEEVDGSYIQIPDVEGSYRVERVPIRSKPHDLALVKVRLVDGVHVPTPIVLADAKPSTGDNVRVYGYKHDLPEERTGVVRNFTPEKVNDYIDRADHNLNKIMGVAGRFLDIPVDDISEEIDLSRRVRDNTFYTDCIGAKGISVGWSGGPVVDESTGKLLGITKKVVWDEGIRTRLGITDRELRHGSTYIGILKQMIDHYLDKEA